MKTIEIQQVHLKIKKIIKILTKLHENNENHKHIRIPFHNHNNHGNHRVPYENLENQVNLKMQIDD